MMIDRRAIAGRFTRYGIVGLVTNTVAYMLFLILLQANVFPAFASGIVYIVAVMASYVANSRWSFKSSAGHTNDIPRFVLSHVIGFGVAVVSMAILSRWMVPALAQILVIGFTATVIFLLLEFLGFGRKREA